MKSLSNEKLAKRIIKKGYAGRIDTSLNKITPLLLDLRGSVLEIGSGSGSALSRLSADIHYVGLEPNSFLHDALREAIRARGFRDFEIIGSTAEKMPFPDSFFDAVISVRTMCSVHDLDGVISQIERVLKPGGVFIFTEHVAAPRGNWRRYLQQLVAPLWRRRMGCSPAIDVEEAIRRAGFSNIHIEPFRVGGRSNLTSRLRIFGVAVARYGDEGRLDGLKVVV